MEDGEPCFEATLRRRPRESQMESPITNQVFEEIEREHRALHQKLRALHDVLASDINARDEFVSMLHDLRKALEVHFANEEFHGFFGEVVEHAPHLKRDADLLCVEHRDMLHTATELARFAAAGSCSTPWWRELRTRFDAFSDQLLRHESDENELLQRTYNDDLGESD
jgi:hypothetical protein